MTPFMGILNDEDVANIIAYMKSISVHAEQPANGDAPAADDTNGEAPAAETAAPEGEG